LFFLQGCPLFVVRYPLLVVRCPLQALADIIKWRKPIENQRYPPKNDAPHHTTGHFCIPELRSGISPDYVRPERGSGIRLSHSNKNAQ
jgi:hypothetical protein